MDELLTEKEQIEAIRGWWRENGRFIIGGIVVGVALLFGWNYWQAQQDNEAAEASAVYESLLDEVAAGEMEAARAIAADLNDNYASTVYAGQARLAMAKLYMDLGRDRDAADELSALLAAKNHAEAQLLARLRLAKILLYQDRPQEAIELLESHRDTAFAARYSETLGDAYRALGRTEDAAEAYALALADNPNAPTVDRTLVQMKINDLPSTREGAGTEPGAGASADAATGEEAAE